MDSYFRRSYLNANLVLGDVLEAQSALRSAERSCDVVALNNLTSTTIHAALVGTDVPGFDPEFMEDASEIDYVDVLKRAEVMRCSPLRYLLQIRRTVNFFNFEEFLTAVEEFGSVMRTVTFQVDTDDNEDLLLYLSDHTQLERLELPRNSVTDGQFEYFSNLINLRVLNVDRCVGLTDLGLAYLSGLTQLQSLELRGSKEITDEGLLHLEGMKDLIRLILGVSTELSDLGLLYVSRLRSLVHFNLEMAFRVTNEGMRHLAELTRLMFLQLNWCVRIDDDGLFHLLMLHYLRRLDLNCCHRVTDTGLAHLEILEDLESLSMNSCTGLTNDGISDFHVARKQLGMREVFIDRS
jgi:hypothetical protein